MSRPAFALVKPPAPAQPPSLLDRGASMATPQAVSRRFLALESMVRQLKSAVGSPYMMAHKQADATRLYAEIEALAKGARLEFQP